MVGRRVRCPGLLFSSRTGDLMVHILVWWGVVVPVRRRLVRGHVACD